LLLLLPAQQRAKRSHSTAGGSISTADADYCKVTIAV
jgi:hypothetical protein